MSEDERHKREVQGALRLIADRQAKAARDIREIGTRVIGRWYYNGSYGRLAIEGISVFALGILVGLGLNVLYKVFTF